MKRLKLFASCAFLALAASCVSAAPAPFAPYRTGDWKALLRVHAGAPFIVHFWGVTCGPCIVELPKWSEFTKRNPAVPIVFVEVDPAPEPVARRILAQAHLDAADNRLLASPFDEYMRYEVDRKWVGELPATLLVDRNGQARRLSGEVNFHQVDDWLARQRRRAPSSSQQRMP
jgi:thiol-disulfide isomerase/thioredoxin